MKLSLVIFAFTMLFETAAIDLPKIRTAYQEAANDESKAKILLEKVDAHSGKSATLLGYKGAVTMMMAKFQLNPLSKLDFFNKGKTILEQAIAKDDDNIELIFIRFSVQSNAPTFLDYNRQLPKDKQFLLVNLADVKDKDLKNRITQFLKTSPYLTDAERSSLH
jgi:hypothetical protein